MADDDFEKLGDQLRRRLSRAGSRAQRRWRTFQPHLRKGSAEVGRVAGVAFEELGSSLRRFADRVRDRRADDRPADAVDADVVDTDDPDRRA